MKQRQRSLLGILSSLVNGFLEDSKNIIITIYPVLLFISHLQLDTSVGGEENSLADFYSNRSERAGGILKARSGSDDLTKLCLLLLLFGQEDASLSLGDGLCTTDEDTVCEGNVALEVGQHVCYLFQ